ncbi:hypothetical protein QJS83_09700 [Bdellovibrio sp. 22V]|uniref:hypothetical protein n=1 Tax=Bdellovibrio sp. 22V TaxID=3044166 RepID=UPI002542C51C|nr:hypothetical protein [Bdellovibrio sp. 22V]WII70733.1 hypothetical protein QJS83_09700 [Bdellovibrio sp. 22V]
MGVIEILRHLSDPFKKHNPKEPVVMAPPERHDVEEPKRDEETQLEGIISEVLDSEGHRVVLNKDKIQNWPEFKKH